MKKLLYLAVAAIAALSSCADDAIVNENENENQNNKVEAPVFTATIEGEAQTRTQLVEGSEAGKLIKVNWEESGEEVKMLFVNAAALEGESRGTFSSPVYQVTRSAEDASTATLTIKEGETYNSAADLFFAAVYPASIVTVDNSASSLADAVKYNFPATQVYKGDGKIGFAPMLGPNPGFSNYPPDLSLPQSFTFGNACALLEITVPYTEMTSVRSITVSSDLRMNGEIKIEGLEYFCFKNPSNPGDGENLVTLDCYSLNNANVAIPQGGSKTFYVSIVPRESTNSAPYLKYLQIDVTDGTTTKTMRTKTFEGTKTSGIEIKPNTIYPITFADNAASATGIGNVGWVQLWTDGPKFAEYNVGVTDGKAESYGGYYCWGSSIDKDQSAAYKSGTDPLTGTDDTATNLWGNNWRMPTKAELDGLLTNCDVEWTTVGGVNGLKFTGKVAPYTSNSVFLPAAGDCDYGDVRGQGSLGYCWSSTPNGSYDAYDLNFLSGYQDVGSLNRDRGFSVRAVLAK